MCLPPNWFPMEIVTFLKASPLGLIIEIPYIVETQSNYIMIGNN